MLLLEKITPYMRVLQPGIALDFETVVIYSSRSSSYSTNAFIL